MLQIVDKRIDVGSPVQVLADVVAGFELVRRIPALAESMVEVMLKRVHLGSTDVRIRIAIVGRIEVLVGRYAGRQPVRQIVRQGQLYRIAGCEGESVPGRVEVEDGA